MLIQGVADAPTGFVETGKVTSEAPWGMGTASGITTTPALLVLGRITALLSGAGTFRVITALSGPPPITLFGRRDKPPSKGATVNVLARWIPAPEAEMSIDRVAETPTVLTAKVIEVAPS